MDSSPGFAAEIVASRPGPVRGFNGMELSPSALLAGSADYGVVVVPAMLGNLDAALADRQAVDWLRRQHARGAVLCAVCAGVFLLAETGLLEGLEATTHWNLAEPFRARYPGVRLKAERLLVDHGDVVTAGGITAYLDLCLHLVARLASRELAALCSKMLLVDPGRRSQVPYTVHSMPRGHGDAAVLRAQEWLEARLEGDASLEAAARAAGLGVRTLLRRFRKATGHTPLEYVQTLRVEAAKRLLETTDRTVEDLAGAVGYADPASFRRVFKARSGLSPGAYRRRFSLS
jgi:transcriptional regulator GlxA family with amidase domain